MNDRGSGEAARPLAHSAAAPPATCALLCPPPAGKAARSTQRPRRVNSPSAEPAAARYAEDREP